MPSYDVSDPNSKNGGKKDSTSDPRTRPPLVKSASVDKPEKSPSLPRPSSKSGRPPLESQLSSASMRRRGYTRRQSSSFDFPHLDSVVSAPNLELEQLDLDAVPWWTSHRLRLAILCFLGFVSLYAQRVNLSIAIVSMVSHTHLIETGDYNISSNETAYENLTDFSYAQNLSTVDSKCPVLSVSAIKGEFTWSKELEGLILGAFFWGYLVLQIPGGRLGERFGAKKVIAITMFPVAILNILSPVVARTSPYLFLVLRIFVGLGEGAMYPAGQALWSKWSPPSERSRLIGFSYAGGQFGNAIIFPIGGYLCAYGFDGGWPSVFYVVGIASFIWCIFWVIFAHDTPDDDKTITELEKKYIKFSLGDRAKAKFSKSIPWKPILTSKPVWAIVVAHMCGNYGGYMLLTKMPAYMKEVLKFDIKSNGLYSMLPYLTFWFFITLSGMFADFLISRNFLSIAWTRKLMSVLGLVGPATFLVATSFMECDQQIAAVIMLTISVGMCGFHFSGYFINHGDIAPPFAGTLFGISNMMATIPGIFSPYIVSALTKNGTREEWQSAFYIAAAIYCFGALWFVILGQGNIQKWAGGEDEEEGPGEGVGFGLHEIQEAKEEEEEDEEEDNKEKKLVPVVKSNKEDNGSLKNSMA